jgi:hypothetical protein
MEIGSFLEIELGYTGEYYQGEKDIARLNTGRCGVLHALRLLNISSIWLPFYLCPTVRSFLVKKGIEILPFYIKENFEPNLSDNDKSTAILIVNYFGILSHKRIIEISGRFKNVIIDNCPAFFCKPLKEYYNIYSTRKFFGVPDGSYVVGPAASRGILNYDQDSSCDTSAFLLKRIERGSSAVYAERMDNENRLDQSDIMKMSYLTRRILQSIDYKHIRVKRFENFNYAHSLFKKYNLLDPERFMDQGCVPMVYPLLIEDDDLVNKMKNNKIYTGRWWSGILNEVPEYCFEAYLSRFMIPIPIDQRYGKKEIDFIFRIFRNVY